MRGPGGLGRGLGAQSRTADLMSVRGGAHPALTDFAEAGSDARMGSCRGLAVF